MLDADSVAVRMVTSISFGTVLFSSLVRVRELPEFMLLMSRDRSIWPRCLLWHGWLPGLSTAGMRDPYAAYFGQLAHRSLEQVLDAYPADASDFWTPPDFWDADDLALGLDHHPSVWTDGSREDYPTGGFEVADAGVFLPAPEEAMREAVWGTTEEDPSVWTYGSREVSPTGGVLRLLVLECIFPLLSWPCRVPLGE